MARDETKSWLFGYPSMWDQQGDWWNGFLAGTVAMGVACAGAWALGHFGII